MEANLGGTELLPALKAVLEQPTSPELPRQIVILTDGEVTNTDSVLALAKAHAATSRIFTFGIGAGASHHLVRGLARAGGGTAEFIHPGERIEPKVLRQIARLLAPALTNVRIEWINGRVTQAPERIPPVFADGRLTVYGFVKDARPTSVRLTAIGPSGPLMFEVPLAEAVRSTRTVSTLAARARIRELEEGPEWLTSRGSQQKERKAETVKKEIIELSVQYGLISRETSFVAIERRETPVLGDVKLRKVPIALTAGWGDLERRSRFLNVRLGASMTTISPAMYAPVDGMSLAAPVERSSPAPRAVAKSLRSFLHDISEPIRLRMTEASSARPANVPTDIERLVVLQTIDGSWRLTKDLASILGHDLADLNAAVRGATGKPDEVLRAWATALAIVWLEQNAADREVEWRLLAEKARKWLDATTAVPPSPGTWHDLAANYMTPASRT
jgi:Ca-activated chloride channel family protein